MKKLILRLSLLLGVLLLLTAAVFAAAPLDGTAAIDGDTCTASVGLPAGTEATSGKLEITYDTAQLTLVSAEPSKALEKAVCTVNTDEAGKIVFVFLKTQPVKGTLLDLRFRLTAGVEETTLRVEAKELYLRLTPVTAEPLTLTAKKAAQPEEPEEPEKPCDGGADCVSKRFTDVNTSYWYHSCIDYAVSHELFGGTSATTFEPDAPMTRAMLVTVLWRYEGQPKGYSSTFSDVNAKDGGWYADAVAWAAANGVVNGVGNNRFDPNGKITREQMAAILYRYAEKKGMDTSKRGNISAFPDAGSVSAYASDAIRWAVGEQIINGSDGKLLPQGNATRAQVAAILMRFAENIAK